MCSTTVAWSIPARRASSRPMPSASRRWPARAPRNGRIERSRRPLSHEIAVRLSVRNHLFAIRIERVVDDPFGGIERVIVLEAEMAKALGNRLEAGAFGLVIERVFRIGAVDDLAEQDERRVAGELVFLQNRLERAFLAVMAELDVLDVVRGGVETLGLVHHLVGRREDELRLAIDEFADEPRAGDAVYLYALAGDPLHRNPP